jgi:hypothetical protein
MSNGPKRFLCRLQLSERVTVYTCGRCTWTYRVEGDDTSAGQAAFDAHRCEDFPLPLILPKLAAPLGLPKLDRLARRPSAIPRGVAK